MSLLRDCTECAIVKKCSQVYVGERVPPCACLAKHIGDKLDRAIQFVDGDYLDTPWYKECALLLREIRDSI